MSYMNKTIKSGEGLRDYTQPSLRSFNIGIHIPVCATGVGASTEDYGEDDIFANGNN